MTQYRFRLTGVPPDQAIKYIDVDTNQIVSEIKKVVQTEYKLNPILAIQFIFKGKIIPDDIRFAKISVHPKKDVITIMASQTGGMKLSNIDKILTLEVLHSNLLRFDKAIYTLIDYLKDDNKIEQERIVLEELSIKISKIINDAMGY